MALTNASINGLERLSSKWLLCEQIVRQKLQWLHKQNKKGVIIINLMIDGYLMQIFTVQWRRHSIDNYC